jgi:hypothetical protein
VQAKATLVKAAGVLEGGRRPLSKPILLLFGREADVFGKRYRFSKRRL